MKRPIGILFSVLLITSCVGENNRRKGIQSSGEVVDYQSGVTGYGSTTSGTTTGTTTSGTTTSGTTTSGTTTGTTTGDSTVPPEFSHCNFTDATYVQSKTVLGVIKACQSSTTETRFWFNSSRANVSLRVFPIQVYYDNSIKMLGNPAFNVMSTDDQMQTLDLPKFSSSSYQTDYINGLIVMTSEMGQVFLDCATNPNPYTKAQACNIFTINSQNWVRFKFKD